METFNEYLTNVLNQEISSNVASAMNYSLLAGGKRLRPQLIFAIMKGYNLDPSLAYSAAASLEMIHTYSLIHDDLPAMDNDDLRRGKKTCHKQFDEATAILAGDALLTYSFQNLANSNYDLETKNQLIRIYSQCAGLSGMIYGQNLDMLQEHQKQLTIDEVNQCYIYKTGKLFTAALQAGIILAHKLENLELMETLGENLGIAFQIQDDVFDVIKTANELGKSNSDILNDKVTYVSLLGLDKAQQMMDDYFDKCYQLIKQLNLKSDDLKLLLDKIRYRNK